MRETNFLGDRSSMRAASHAGASAHWERMWSAGLPKGAAFDVGAVSQTLAAELARKNHAPRRGMTALVPGAGRGYDALALALAGFDTVVSCDLAPTACNAARSELRDASGAGHADAAAKVRVECSDFFELDGQYDLIWDCTFLCALEPSVRDRWAAQHRALLSKSGTLLTCVFPICEKSGGPPFAMSVPLVRSLLEPTGLVAMEVRGPLPSEEQHVPGAFSKGQADTALITWRHSCDLE